MKALLIVALILASMIFVASAVARSYPHVGGYKLITPHVGGYKMLQQPRPTKAERI